MTITVKQRTPLVVPANVQRRAGIKAGDRLEFKTSRGVITIVTRGQVAADEEHTLEQRRAVNAQLAESLEDVRKGRVYGPFATVVELERSLRRTAQKTASRSKTRRSARR